LGGIWMIKIKRRSVSFLYDKMNYLPERRSPKIKRKAVAFPDLLTHSRFLIYTVSRFRQWLQPFYLTRRNAFPDKLKVQFILK